MLTHFLTSQPALIKLDNENIGGHLTPLPSDSSRYDSTRDSGRYANHKRNPNI